MDADEIKQAIDQLARAHEEYKATLEQGLKKHDAVTEEKLKRLNDALDTLQERVTQAENAIARPGRNAVAQQDEERLVQEANIALQSLAALRGRPTAQSFRTADEVRAYKADFLAYARTGADRALAARVEQDMSVSVDADGGYLVPSDMTGRIALRIFDLSPIRQIAFVQPTTASELEGLADNDQAEFGWTGETEPRPETATPRLGKWIIAAEEAFAQPKVTTKLLADAAVDVEAWLIAKVGDRMARGEGDAFINGNGIKKPRGFCTYTTAPTADEARAWGVLQHWNTGVNAAFAASNPADILIDVIESVKSGYRDAARWVTRRSVTSLIRKFKESTTNAYLWQPGLQAGQPATLLGYPVTMAEDMPALAAGSLSLAFGNFAAGYTIVDRAGMTVLRDPYTEKGFVKFYTTRRVGGGVTNSEAIKFVRFGT